MKIQAKTKKALKRRASNRPTAVSKSVKLAYAKRSVLRHFKLVGHKHTGKLIHPRNTSHVALTGILILTGFFLYANSMIAEAVTHSDSVTVGVVVPGAPPSTGAFIGVPVDGAEIVNTNIIYVSGTCAPETLIVISDNGTTAGSAACTGTGTFSLHIQVDLGKNILSAHDYDNLNQPGPSTPSVTVNVTKTQPAIPDNKTPTVVIDMPTIPENPTHIAAIEPEFTSCSDYKPNYVLQSGGDTRVAVVCAPRLFEPGTPQVFGFIVWGGAPPYLVNIDWHNSAPTDDVTLSFDTTGYKTVTLNYAIPGTYRIVFIVTDNEQKKAVVETAIQTNGEAAIKPASTPINNIVSDIINKSWFDTPVPFYLTAVAITLGFWGGDIFSAKFGMRKNNHSRRRKPRRWNV